MTKRLFSGIFFHFLMQNAWAKQPFTSDLWLNDVNASVKVNDLLQDGKGYQWLATEEGLYRYNGRTLLRIADSLQRPVTAVALVNGTVYAGYADGSIGYVHNSEIIKLTLKNEKPLSRINAIYSGGGPVYWVCTEEEGIFAIINNTGVAIGREEGLPDNFVYNVCLLPGYRLLAGTDRGISELSFGNNKILARQYSTAQGLPDNIVKILAHIPRSALYWCGTQQGGLALFSAADRSIIPLQADSAWSFGQVNDILPLTDTRAWVATEDGYLLEVTRQGANRILIKPLHFEGKRLNKLLRGRSGIIWAATQHGLTSMTAEYMQYVRLQPPYRLADVSALACDRNNVLWIAMGKNLFHIPLNGNEQRLGHSATLPAPVTSLYADKENRLWIGTLGKGMWCKTGAGQPVNISDIPPLANESILDITGTSDRLWVAGLNGVEEIFYPGQYTQKMDLVKQHNKHSGIGSDYVYQLYADRKGRIWMATDGAGVTMHNAGGYKHWDTADGLKSRVVYSVTEDAGSGIWAATLSDGIFMYDDNKWRSMQEMGVQDKNISTIDANATGQVVVVNTKGIDVWYPASGLFRNYPRKIFDIDSTSTVLKLSARDTDGNVYIPFEDGLIIFRNIYGSYDIRPSVNISAVSVFLNDVTLGKTEFSPAENHISFRFESVNFANPDKLHYRYKLDGYNERWIVTSDESVTFPQLPDGRYTFRVQASLNNVFHRAGEATYSFTIAKPVWKRGWFITLMVLALSVIVYTYVRLREKNLRKVSLLQRERMMFEYEHLKSQVNPHFLFNSLNTLSVLIDEDKETAMKYTSQLSDLYRNVLSHRHRDLISLAEEWEILENYLYIQTSRFGNALQLEKHVPDEVMEARRIVPLALQILVENAIKHNVASLSRPLKITITATSETLTIRNNFQPKLSKEKGEGLGLINIRNRYALLTKKQMSYGVENGQYIVTLPLL